MHQRRGLNGLARCLPTEFLRSKTPEFAINDRQQLIEGLWITFTDCAENLSDVWHRRHYSQTIQYVLVWTNPVSGSIRGRVYLWTHEGIPTLIASVYKYDNQIQISSECHALARRPIAGKSGSGETWKVDVPSVEFKTIPNAGKPGATR